ncbi:YqcC family protein [Photobacterium sp. GJ3]|uniref:YqcC family protein n=1 Tax=Photobacterium sp. GJ3 TaxID=2829502 RepID=UPI001B8AC637|nr:YqcC family protein [Photobacterium sp. GJ3]QUJ66913.1 YqcC family protein [Photobacterium sp. GJ3]
MDPYEKTASLLAALELQLHEQGLWQSEPPSEAALSSTLPFAVDMLTCAEWLQWIFLPNMYHVLSERLPLPTAFCIYPYVEEAARQEPGLDAVLPVISALDDWLGGANA